MVERRSGGDRIGEPSITNIDLSCDYEDLTMAVFLENQSDHSPVKKRRVDDQENTPQQDSDHKIPGENTSAPAHKHNDQSKVDDNQIPHEKIPDQSERKGPGPGFRVLPRGAYCVSKTLNSKDVIPINPQLYLSAYDACFLTGGLKIVQSLPGSYKKSLVVFDEGHRKYNMILSNHIRGKYKRYSISVDWERFVKVHNLQAGDKISFNKISDVNDSDDYAYILKYVRKSSDNKDIDAQNSRNPRIEFDHKRGAFRVMYHRPVSLENTLHKRKRNVTGPGSSFHHLRAMTREAYCLSKTLTSIEVGQRNAKLYFDPYDASVLTDCPEIGRYPLCKYSKDLLVFDRNDRKYFMNLSHCISGGEIRSYCINRGWNRFLRKHTLKEGDGVTFYRFRDTSGFKLKYYYVLKYFRKPPDVDELKNKPSDDAAQIDKHNGSAELKVGEITRKKTILLSKKNRESKVRDNEVQIKNACDCKMRNAHGPDSRHC